MTTEAGGFTLNGQPFLGGRVTAENGNVYVLLLVSGRWIAAYVPERSFVRLGDSGGSVTDTQAEDGTYWVPRRETTFLSGDTVTGSDGETYCLTLCNGRWTATLVEDSPQPSGRPQRDSKVL